MSEWAIKLTVCLWFWTIFGLSQIDSNLQSIKCSFDAGLTVHGVNPKDMWHGNPQMESRIQR
jgi:hypothetical protein